MFKSLVLCLLVLVGTIASDNQSSPTTKFGNDTLQQVFDQYIIDNTQDDDRSLSFWNYPILPNPIAHIGNLTNSKNYLSYAGATYCPSEKLLNWSCGNCKGYTTGSTNITYFYSHMTDSAGYLAINHRNKEIVIAYRGTNDLYNWLYNLAYSLTPSGLSGLFTSARIHFGFNLMTDYLYEQTKTSLLKAIEMNPNYKLIFTGHSLGGAITELMAFKLAENNIIKWEDINVVTYGQPRSGNLDFAKYLNSKPWSYIRVTSSGDIVPYLPPIPIGFSHHQYNLFIDQNGNNVECSIISEDLNCLTSIWNIDIGAHSRYWGIDMNTSCN